MSNIVEVIKEHAKAGIVISHQFVSETLDNNPKLEAGALAGCLSSCLKAVTDHLSNGAPEDAENWARISLKIAERIVNSSDVLALTRAQSSIGKNLVERTKTQAALAAVDFHDDIISKRSSAFETAHVLNTLSALLFGNIKFAVSQAA